VDQDELLKRITVDPAIFGGKPIVRGRRLAVEHVLGMLAAGDDAETILAGYRWLEPEDIQACLVYAHQLGDADSVPAELRLTAAVKLYEAGHVSSGAAATLAGIPRTAFLFKLGDFGVDTFRLSREELERDRDRA
jgi:uncharacterized protein (DUF433 family)